jgi:hypothetical protein
MKIATERNLLYAYAPIDVHNPHQAKLVLPYTNPEIGTTVTAGKWGAEEQMVFDILTDIMRVAIYKNRRPTRREVKKWASKYDPEIVKEEFTKNHLDSKFFIKLPTPVTHAQIVTRYTFLRKYTPKTLHDLFQRASEISFKCKYRYKVCEKVRSASGTMKEELGKRPFESSVSQRLFTFDHDDVNKSYLFKFITGMGLLFVNNIAAAELEWLPSELYGVSRNAQNLYRKFMLTRKKGTGIEIPCVRLATMLNLKTSNETARRKSIEGYLNQLLNIGLIEYRVEKGYKDFKFGIKKVVSN